MARFSIMVIEYGSDREIELCRLDGNPDQVVAGLNAKTLTVHTGNSRRRTKIRKYTKVSVVDHRDNADA